MREGIGEVDQLLRHVDLPADLSACWIFKCGTQRSFWVRVRGRLITPPRFAFQLYKGPIPEGHLIARRCRNRKCVNPDHLEARPLSEVRRYSRHSLSWEAVREIRAIPGRLKRGQATALGLKHGVASTYITNLRSPGSKAWKVAA